jgi:diketogulonate reductase-like aldo/keto reductase
MSSFTIKSTTKLLSGNVIPLLGFGVWDSPKDVTTKSCLEALKVGYRHIDTAQGYGNEAEVGEAVRQSGLKREDVFLTSKIFSPGSDDAETYNKCAESVRKTGGENGYLDLMLIHNVTPGAAGIKMIWQSMEKLQQEGKIKSIGVSNFGIAHIEQMKQYAKFWPPAVNQLEVCSLHRFEICFADILS